MVDLGGGSCELTVSRKGHIRDTVSLPLGAVRLTSEFLLHDPPRKGELERLRGFVAREMARISGSHCRAARVPGCDRHFGHGGGSGGRVGHAGTGTEAAARGRSHAGEDAPHRQDSHAAAASTERENSPASGRGAPRSSAPARSCMANFWSAASSLAFATLHLGCGTACWPRWRRNTIAARARESTSNRSGGTRSSARSSTIAWICIMRCRCGSRPCYLFQR